MRLITNEKLVTRNAKIGHYTSRAGFIALIAALALNIFSLANISNPAPGLLTAFFAVLLIAMVLTSIGNVFTARWGQRPDRGLAEALKGLDDRYALYNYRLGASHVLAGPSGVIVLTPNYRPGRIEYRRGKWRGTKRNALVSFFSADPLGHPSAEAAAEVESLLAFLKRYAPEIEIAPQAAIVFMHNRAELDAAESPIPALHVKQLKDYIRRLPKNSGAAAEALAALAARQGW